MAILINFDEFIKGKTIGPERIEFFYDYPKITAKVEPYSTSASPS